MENGIRDNEEEEATRLVVAIIDFLRDQLIVRTDLVPEDRDCLEMAMQCLEMAYGLEARRYVQYRFSRPLLDVFNQVANPVSIRDKLRAEAHKDEGNSYMRRNMFSNAEAEYTQAIELDKWNAIYYCNRASSRIEQNNFFEAISDCRQALMLNPDYAKAHARMGQAYALIHRPREAARCFRQALELEPTNERYRNNLAVAERQISRSDELGLVAAILSTIFGTPSRDINNPISTINMPTSFMIITESHPPTREVPSGSETEIDLEGESEQSSEMGHTDESTEVSSVLSNCSTEGHPIVYPLPYGVIYEGSEEQPLPEIDVPTNVNEEFVIEIPDYVFLPDESSPSRPSAETEGGQTKPDLLTDAKVTASERKPPYQKMREEEQTLNAKIKVSGEDAAHSGFKVATGNLDTPTSSTEPPIIPEYMPDSKTSTEVSYNRVQPDTNQTKEDSSMSLVSDNVLPVNIEAKDKIERKDELEQDKSSDFQNSTGNFSVVENDRNADNIGQYQQSNENETGNTSTARNINNNKERRNDDENPDDDDEIIDLR